MNETELILGAIQKSAPPKRRRKVMREFEPSPVEENDTVLRDLANKQVKRRKTTSQRKRKSIIQWSNTDFIKYLSEMLSVHGLRLSSTGVRDRDNISRVYDAMAERLQEEMSNAILKTYFEWWVSSYGPFLTNEPIYTGTFAADHLIEKFLSRYDYTKQEAPKVTVKEEAMEIDEYTLYDLGGLPMVLTSKGLVVTYKVLREKKIDDIFSKISSALRDLSKDAVCTTMENTFKGAPYKEGDKVDFISVSRRALEFHGLKKYKKISYQDYFK